MNIIEATKKAMEENRAIFRKSQPYIQFVPTNSVSLAFVVIATDTELAGRMCNPYASDILAEDWDLY